MGEYDTHTNPATATNPTLASHASARPPVYGRQRSGSKCTSRRRHSPHTYSWPSDHTSNPSRVSASATKCIPYPTENPAAHGTAAHHPAPHTTASSTATTDNPNHVSGQ